jgi:uncharacterized protein with PIN domain
MNENSKNSPANNSRRTLMTMDATLVEKGAIIQCPACNVNLYEVVRTIRPFEVVAYQWLKGIAVPDPKYADPMTCGKCRAEYFSGGKFLKIKAPYEKVETSKKG